MFPKTGKKFPGGNDPEIDGASYTAIIARALTTELGETHRAAKIVMRWTGASERTVKHWLAGAHGPCGDHLLVLMRESETVLKSILAAAGRRDAIVALRMLAAQSAMMEVTDLMGQERMMHRQADAPGAGHSDDGERNDRENERDRERNRGRDADPSSAGMNLRQSWFLGALRAGNRVRIADLKARWAVSDATARRDVAELRARGVIEFVGSRRSGTYRLIPRK